MDEGGVGGGGGSDGSQVLMPYCETMVVVGTVAVAASNRRIEVEVGVGVDITSDEGPHQPTEMVLLALHRDFAIQLVQTTSIAPSSSSTLSTTHHSQSIPALMEQSDNSRSIGSGVSAAVGALSGGSPSRHAPSRSPLRSPLPPHLSSNGGGSGGGSGGFNGRGRLMEERPTAHGPLGVLDLMLG